MKNLFPLLNSKYSLMTMGICVILLTTVFSVNAATKYSGCHPLCDIKLVQENTSFDVRGMLSGVVTNSEDGTPAVGVNVYVKGTNRGTVTDLDGRFSIEVEPEETLLFQFLGMETVKYLVQEEDLTNSSFSLSIEMTMSAEILLGDLSSEEVYKTKRIRKLFKKSK